MNHALSDTYQAAIGIICAVLDSASALRPNAAGLQEQLPITSDVWAAFMKESDVGRRGIVQRVYQWRMDLASSSTLPLSGVTRRKPGGRFLAYDPDDSLSDGAAMAATVGFYSFDNMPPGVLWLDYIVEPTSRVRAWAPFTAYLLCWVPDDLIVLANKGIEINVEGCLRWLS